MVHLRCGSGSAHAVSSTVKRGDLILGCEGFEKGCSIVILDDRPKCTTNFHGTVITIASAALEDIIALRCFFFRCRWAQRGDIEVGADRALKPQVSGNYGGKSGPAKKSIVHRD